MDKQHTDLVEDCVRKLQSGIALVDVCVTRGLMVQGGRGLVVQGGRGWCTTFCLGKKWYTNPVPPVPPNPVPPVPPPKLNIVIWARSESRAALAGEFKRIPPVLDDMAQVVGTHAPVVDEADERGLQKALAKGGACLVKTKSQGVGLLAAGSSAAHTTAALLVLEKSAKVYWEAELLGGAKPIKRREAWLMHLVYKRKYSQMESKAVHQTLEDFTRKIPADEMAARQAIIKTGLSLLEKNLVQGTWGNISLRLDEQFMLVTPSGLEYDLLTPFDIVRVNLHTQEYEGKLKPTSEKIIHAELLKSKPGVNCVIHSHPVNCSSFAAAHKPVVAPDEASRELLGGDATLAKYALPGSKRLAKNALAALKQSQACIMENHGMLVCGTSLDDALKKCETLERLAGSHIDGLVSEPQGRGN